ncbi:MAG TPA: tetratricopeptide repeat protein, partial [Myxococcales bacterium]|nr:tetratricopeptide repeat protein [Myxococcales bacterium]
PTSQNEVARDAATDQKRDELIQELQAIIPKIPEGDRKAELDFQLAELWWEKARYVALQEVKDYDDAFAAWSQSKKGAEPKVSTAKSDGFRREALKLYQVILHDDPRYDRRDEVLFVAAYNRYEIGEKKEAVANYTELIQKHPQSKFVPDAYVQLGEHYFVSNDLKNARASFEKAASFKLPKLYAFAVYKLAWCDYNAADYNAAIDKFKQVISYSDSQESSKDRIQLKNEALKDIVLSYARIDSVEPAEAYLKEKGGDRSTDYVNKLAATYYETGKLELAIRVYKKLIAGQPANVRAPAWQEKVMTAYDKLGRRDQVVVELKRLVSDFGPKSQWAHANAGQKGALAEANDLSESALRELVRDYHQEAIKTKNVATYKLARDIYRQYLETFPGSEAAYQERFFYAEILYALEQWDDAAAQYSLVVEADPKGSYSPKAAYDAILALEKSIAIGKGKLKKRDLADAAKIDERKAKGQVDQRRAIKVQAVTKEIAEEPIPDTESKLMAACDKYVMVAGGSKDEIVIRYKAALIAYDHKHFIDAARRFGDIIDRFPNDAFSQKAANLSLDILNTKEAWQEATDLTTRFLQNKKLTPPGSSFEKDVAKIGERARFNYVMQVYEVQKDYPAAAGGFKEFVARYPASENAPKALYNAMIIADKADQLDLELAAGKQLLADYPKADVEIVKLAIPSLASAAERSALYPQAIADYEDAQSRWPREAKAADWLYNAAIWREALGDDAGALADWQKYLKQYGARPDTAKIAFAAGLCIERQKDARNTAEYWRSYDRQYGGSATAGQLLLARYKEAIALREARLSDASALADVTQRYARLPADDKGALPLLDAAAHARFLQVESAYNEFMAIHFQYTRQGDLVRALKVKNARMTRLLAAYGEVIAIGAPRWSEAAFDRIGEAYRNFNKGLLDAPMPKGLDPEQQELYRSTLESQALPFEDKAAEAFGKAVEVSQKSGAYSDWVIKAQDFLREYQADSYGEIHKPAFEGRALARSIAPGND